MMMSDIHFMRLALRLARRGCGMASQFTNPLLAERPAVELLFR
jgi:hypothetical protein